MSAIDIVLTEWLSAGLRWLHVLAGISWIGSSFYFIHLDLSLRPTPGRPEGTQGEAWQVHGGGFYNMVKYLVAPARLPRELTWFKWEAYTTWLSGFSLLIVTYYWSADLFFVDRAVLDIGTAAAITLSLGTLLAGWLAYEAMCRSSLGRDEVRLALVGFVFLVGLAWGFTHAFSGRGAFIQMGALIGTMMVANVFVVIIPNQKRVVAALLAGAAPDPDLGKQAKQRSVHNNYLTLPVVFLMLANHYPLFFATRYNWLIFAIVLLIGFIIRHFYNLRHAGLPNPWWTWVAAAIGMAAIAFLSWAGARSGGAAAASGTPPPSFDQVAEIIATRCSMCHMAEPVWNGFIHAPDDVLLDTPDDIAARARQIMIFAVLTDAMPPGNVTLITEEERRLVGAGLAGRAAWWPGVRP
ncbi:MAG: urate hydroxylase PuuD [Proteobacteria bacterium]|nr:urate hydroxylase PuuD [Pseudomonadota bacterium]MBI3499463.1 urate hydroxylase PuuD [Pseudomonadota bacterium]